ncbi:hypothetical protein lerEdw1_021030 [Lerista edwardsae]|nr:hypothetical protein lerEdw1_021030 [Lerista edwardsae]
MQHHGEIKDSQGSSTVVTNNDESHVLTPGKMSQRQGKEGYLTPTKELHPPSFSPGAVHGHGKKHLIKVMDCQIRYSRVFASVAPCN